MKIKTSSFCTIARNADWQAWLESIAPDLYDDLLSQLKKGSCKSNRDKMVNIYKEIKKRGQLKLFEEFISKRFPYVVQSNSKIMAAPAIEKENADKHGIFSHYNPQMLTFPHKLIMVDIDQVALEKRVKEFLRDKVGHDYIIIADRAYIEYFFPQYQEQADKIKKREINDYRSKNSNNF